MVRVNPILSHARSDLMLAIPGRGTRLTNAPVAYSCIGTLGWTGTLMCGSPIGGKGSLWHVDSADACAVLVGRRSVDGPLCGPAIDDCVEVAGVAAERPRERAARSGFLCCYHSRVVRATEACSRFPWQSTSQELGTVVSIEFDCGVP